MGQDVPSPDASPGVAAAPPLSQSEPPRRWLFALAAGLLLLWCVGLMTLAVTTANPPQINLRQLAGASAIVTVSVEDAATGDCRVLERWTAGEFPEHIRVSNLAASGAIPGREYILPLTIDPAFGPGVFCIVDDPERAIPPLAYPRVPEIERQLRAWQSPGG